MKKVRILIEYTTTVEVIQEVPDNTNSLDLEDTIHGMGLNWDQIDKSGSTETMVSVEEIETDEEISENTWEDFVG